MFRTTRKFDIELKKDRINPVFLCIPEGIRTPAAGMKTRCPRPLDDELAAQKESKTLLLFTRVSVNQKR